MIEISHWCRPLDEKEVGDTGIENLFTVEDTNRPVGEWRVQEFPEACVIEMKPYRWSKETRRAMAISGAHIYDGYIRGEQKYPAAFMVVYNNKLYKHMKPMFPSFAFEDTGKVHNGFPFVAIIPLGENNGS